MSGHSKWSTIKRQKGVNDAKRGQLFSKLAKIISIAARDGGGNLESNQKLKAAVEAARVANMPKINIERAIASADKEGKHFEEVVYEGFGPGGLGILIEATTDNRNRTGQEIKNILERSGGGLGGPGSVSFNFEPKGMILLSQKKISDDEMLKIIDLGIDEVEEISDGVEIFTPPSSVYEISEKIKAMGMAVNSVTFTQKPKISTKVRDPKKVERLSKLLDDLDDHEDVQKIHPSFEIF